MYNKHLAAVVQSPQVGDAAVQLSGLLIVLEVFFDLRLTALVLGFGLLTFQARMSLLDCLREPQLVH